LNKRIYSENDELLNYVNKNLMPNWSDEERKDFIEEARIQFADLLQFGVRKATLLS
jgi:hypothetical protein